MGYIKVSRYLDLGIEPPICLVVTYYMITCSKAALRKRKITYNSQICFFISVNLQILQSSQSVLTLLLHLSSHDSPPQSILPVAMRIPPTGICHLGSRA